MKTVQFHFDFLSPYAYLAWHALQRAEKHRGDFHIGVLPTLLAPLLNAAGQKGPAEIPAKRPYVFKDALRGAHKLGLALAPPPSHPFNPLLSLRCVCAAEPGAQAKAVTALFAVAWGGKRFGAGGLDDPEVVTSTLDETGLDGVALVEAASRFEVKAQLRVNTEAALESGCFGVPSMLVAGELFWGFDSLGYLWDHLDGNDPASGADLTAWAGLPATAQRKP